MHDTKKYFYRYYQTGHTTKPQYLETFKKNVSAIDSCGGAIWMEAGLAKAEMMATAKKTSSPTKKGETDSRKTRNENFSGSCDVVRN